MKWRTLAVCLAVLGLVSLGSSADARKPARATGPADSIGPKYRVLAPIEHNNLSVFPVVASVTHDTSGFLTLDQGVRSGEVVVTEYGKLDTMIRGRDVNGPIPEQWSGPQVNRLVLVNNSDRPLLLLAGEIVTGGRQDRVVGKDMIVAPESDPIALDVFCVEPGRWVASSKKFSSMNSAMAAPEVRGSAMGSANQEQVWAQVGKMKAGVIGGSAGGAEADELRSTTSYAQVMKNQAVANRVDAIAAPIEKSYRDLVEKLRDRHAVGVVVAVNGRFVWADIFASTDLLLRYWPKLIRSYAADAMVTGPTGGGTPSVQSAQAFLDNMEGNHQSVDIKPGLFRRTEISGDGFKVFVLASLLPKTGYDLHIAKMATRNKLGTLRYP
ncbi:MAG: hypothetical protein KGL59_01370 [Acidobacteriota bacterium]|nr:hypothetical protein [Acidobacteriota bacterium]